MDSLRPRARELLSRFPVLVSVEMLSLGQEPASGGGYA